VDATLQASIFLKAILPLMENLVEYDQEAAAAIEGENLTVQFDIKNGPAAYLIVEDGAVTHGIGKHPKPDLWLTFPTAERFNQMIGGKGRPGIRKGLTRLGFLTKKFPVLGKRLMYHLRGEGKQDDSPEARRFQVTLGFRALLGGMVAVASDDPKMKSIAASFPVGTMAAKVLPDGPQGSFGRSADGAFVATFGEEVENPNAVMELASLEIARRLIDGEMIPVVAIGTGDVAVRGSIPLVEKINVLLGRVSKVMG
jgi:putative sterol carrier protein